MSPTDDDPPVVRRGPGRPRKDPIELDAPIEEAILDAASRLFSVKGFDGTSIAEITKAVGLRQSSFFYYFPTKKDLIAKLLERAMAPLSVLDRVEGIDAPPDVRLYAQVFLHTRTDLTAGLKVGAIVGDAWRLPREEYPFWYDGMRDYSRRLRHMIVEGAALGLFDRHISTTSAAMSIIGSVIWSNRWFTPGGQLEVDDVARDLARMALRALLADAQRLDEVERAAAPFIDELVEVPAP